jgi:hypothetical protein
MVKGQETAPMAHQTREKVGGSSIIEVSFQKNANFCTDYKLGIKISLNFASSIEELNSFFARKNTGYDQIKWDSAAEYRRLIL